MSDANMSRLPGGRDYPVEYVKAEDGRIYSCATNGFAAVLRQVTDQEPSTVETPRTPYLVAIASWRAKVPVVPVSAAWLIRTVGAPGWDTEEPCPTCDGSGRDPDADPACACRCCRCSYCDGAGFDRTTPAARYMVICDRVINGGLVAAALHLAGAGGRCQVYGYDESSGHSIRVVADTWRIAVMGAKASSADMPRVLCEGQGAPS